MTTEVREIDADPSCPINVYVAGDEADVRRSLRRQCLEDGLCVFVTTGVFIYTAGAEEGVCVHLTNYPRFPKRPDELFARAVAVAKQLMIDLCQWSALVETPTGNRWLTRRPEDSK